MKKRALVFGLLAFCLALPAQAVILTVNQEISNATAQDAFDEFFYDLYTVTVDEAAMVDVTMTPDSNFTAWLGYWDGDLSATPDYFSPPPENFVTSEGVLGAVLHFEFYALSEINYQVMVATFNYKPAELGEYDLSVSVPAPASWIILALGLCILGLLKKLDEGAAPVCAHC
jgi:hypothetical protein